MVHMVIAGSLMLDPISNPTPLPATGYIPTTAGPGCLTTTGDGLLSIMAAGYMIIIMDGSGSLVLNGDQHG